MRISTKNLADTDEELSFVFRPSSTKEKRRKKIKKKYTREAEQVDGNDKSVSGGFHRNITHTHGENYPSLASFLIALSLMQSE